MPKRRYLNLTEGEQAELEEIRDHHEKPYLREKAAALLKVAAGASPHQVALTGLLKPRSPDAVYRWLNTYEAAGVEGLVVQEGRGRKPAFSP
jgi:hypothetical protein